MRLEKGEWNFNGNIPSQFQEHVSDSVPYYETVHDLITELSYWYTTKGSNIYDLGSSTGYLASKLLPLIQKRELKYTGYDLSKDMVDFAREKHSNSLSFIEDNILNVDFKNNTSVVYSVLTLQFLTVEERRELLNNIHNSLNEGGAFIIFEKIIAEDSETALIFDEIYQDFKAKSLEAQHLIEKKQSLRGIMRPIKLEDNLQHLRESGFRTVNTFFQWGNFVGIIAVK